MAFAVLAIVLVAAVLLAVVLAVVVVLAAVVLLAVLVVVLVAAVLLPCRGRRGGGVCAPHRACCPVRRCGGGLVRARRRVCRHGLA